ncbi:MAG: SCP2 sterol-binding domain-containing protein [Chloroflexi bacterium]|nr:SCP2 sterol-binding domain-containing protein [Chloroflexota bacterium]
MQSSEQTLALALEGLRRIFQPDQAANINTVIEFNLTGEGGVVFAAIIHDQQIDFEVENPPKAKVKMQMPAVDFLKMLDGSLSTTDAFASGKMKVGGNLIYAMKLATVFKF